MSLLDSLSTEDRELTETELASISRHLVEWPDKARDLGLSEGDIDNIKNDCSTTKQQKRAMMRRWKQMYGDRASLRELARTAVRKGWEEKFTVDVAKEMGSYGADKEGMLNLFSFVRQLDL